MNRFNSQNKNNKLIVQQKLSSDKYAAHKMIATLEHYSKFDGSNSEYNIICDNKNKIGIMWSFRAGCTITLTTFFTHLKLLEASNTTEVHPLFRDFKKCGPYISIDTIQNEKYDILKIIINPYQRAVSSYLLQNSHNLSFREYLKKILKEGIKFLKDPDETSHMKPQYVANEEKFVTKYLKIDKYETHSFKLLDGTEYLFDPNKLTSAHHSKRKDITYFVGDIALKTVKTTIPKSYKYFYDEEIKKMVSLYFKDDIEKYKYTYDELN